MKLVFGWLCAASQGYSYSYRKMKLGSNFQNNLENCSIKFGWGLDGCARCRKVTITVAMKLNW